MVGLIVVLIVEGLGKFHASMRWSGRCLEGLFAVGLLEGGLKVGLVG